MPYWCDYDDIFELKNIFTDKLLCLRSSRPDLLKIEGYAYKEFIIREDTESITLNF